MVTASAYEPAGPLASLSLGNGLTETRTFTSRYFPESIELSGVSTLFDWTYTQDNEGNVLAIVDGVAPAGNRSYTYQDHQYFLTAGVGPWGGITWTYDQIGNRLSEQRGALTDVYLYDQNAATGNTPLLDSVALGVGGTRDYTYGQAGHVEQVSADINETFFENAADSRLTRLERPAGDAATDFLYDGRSFLARAIERSYENLLTDGFEFGHTDCWTLQEGGVQGPPGPECFQQVTRPVYSSEGVLRALLKTNGPATMSESHYLLYFAGRPVLQLAEDAQGGSTYGYLTTDHLGTPAALCDETGTLLWQGGFEPFGADSFSGAGGAGVYLRFPGQWVDGTWEGSSAGEPVVYNVHRWYQTGLGRYNRADPLGILPPDRNAWNSLIYALGNPSGNSDPLGLDALTDDPNVQDCMYCLFVKAGKGFFNIEEGMWVVCSGASFSCDIWPSTVRQGNSQTATTQSSPRPPGACAVFHTHPRKKLAVPSSCPDSSCDIPVANRLRLPIYTIHPTGVWKYDPATGKVTQEAGEKWHKAPKARCKKPCEGLR